MHTMKHNHIKLLFWEKNINLASFKILRKTRCYTGRAAVRSPGDNPFRPPADGEDGARVSSIPFPLACQALLSQSTCLCLKRSLPCCLVFSFSIDAHDTTKDDETSSSPCCLHIILSKIGTNEEIMCCTRLVNK
jgi:hypothetical protein